MDLPGQPAVRINHSHRAPAAGPAARIVTVGGKSPTLLVRSSCALARRALGMHACTQRHAHRPVSKQADQGQGYAHKHR